MRNQCTMSGLCGLLVLAMENSSLCVPTEVQTPALCSSSTWAMPTPQSNVSDTVGSRQAQEDKEESHHGLLHWHFSRCHLTNVKDPFCFLFAPNNILILICSCLVYDSAFVEILENSPTIFSMTKYYQT